MTVRFVFATDSHYHPRPGKDWGPPKMLTRGREVLEAMVDQINAADPEFIVHGGDLLCGGSSFDLPWEQYLQSIDVVAAALERFRAPLYCVPGNHDCDAGTGTFAPLAERIHLPELLDVVDAAPGLRLALANIYQENPMVVGSGEWTEDHDTALAAAGREALADGCALILVLHPWVLPGFAPPENPNQHLVKGAERLMATVSGQPAVVAVFTGHLHMNRIRMYRDFLIVDTACLIGFPLGFREIHLREDGLLTARFHQLDLPDVLEASRERSSPEINDRWQGEVHDRETEVLLPRLRALWSAGGQAGRVAAAGAPRPEVRG